MPDCLDEFPWRSLKGFGKMAPKMFSLGDYKNERLKDGTPVQFRIIGFNHDLDRNGSPIPITWEMINCLPNRYPWQKDRDTTDGSWPATWLRGAMNNDDGVIFRLFPDELVELVVPALKLTVDSYDGEREVMTESLDKFWIKSEKELFGRNIYSAPGEGHWYEFYRQEDVPWGKKRNGSDEYTMLRSPYYDTANYFCGVSTGGGASNTTSRLSYGLAPAFCF